MNLCSFKIIIHYCRIKLELLLKMDSKKYFDSLNEDKFNDSKNADDTFTEGFIFGYF